MNVIIENAKLERIGVGVDVSADKLREALPHAGLTEEQVDNFSLRITPQEE